MIEGIVVDGWVGIPDSALLHGAPSPATIVPSGWLALELDEDYSNPAAVSDRALVEATIAFDRIAAWAQARQARLIAELATRRAEPGQLPDWYVDEVATALHLTTNAAAVRVAHAQAVTTRLTGTLQLWETGQIDQRRVAVLCDTTANLTDDVAAAVEARVLDRAPEQTTGQLKAALKRAVIAADPDGATERHEKARRDRGVDLFDDQDGMACLRAFLPAPDAVAAYEWLTRLARGLGADDPRTMHERRADLLTDLLTGRITNPDLALPDPVNPGKPLVQVIAPLSALLGTTQDPAELVGYGPITAEIAREIAASATWRRLFTDPQSGVLLDYGRTTYTPPVALADFVKARDVHCRFPGCRRAAVNGELDHVRAWADGGHTSATNLAGLCVRHHHLKHADGGWTVRALPDGGLEWTTPTGRSYVTRPHDYRTDPDPPP